MVFFFPVLSEDLHFVCDNPGQNIPSYQHGSMGKNKVVSLLN